MQLRADTFNLFNHPNPGNIVTNLSQGSFGTINTLRLPDDATRRAVHFLNMGRVQARPTNRLRYNRAVMRSRVAE